VPRHILYAYVDGCDHQDIAEVLDARLTEFVEGRKWTAGRAWSVNQVQDEDGSLKGDDLPLWDLGINLELPDPGEEPPGWFADVQAIAVFAGTLHREFGRDFVIGIEDTETGIAEDLFYVSTDIPDLGRLRSIIGVGNVE
jgi:hypothetical protein